MKPTVRTPPASAALLRACTLVCVVLYGLALQSACTLVFDSDTAFLDEIDLGDAIDAGGGTTDVDDAGSPDGGATEGDAGDTGSPDGGATDADPDASLACVDDNCCGGTGTLRYEGEARVPGDACGCGVLICDGPEALRCFGERVPNDCGGCTPLAGSLGQACGVCGDGVWACGEDGTARCEGASVPNGCGGCTALAGDVGAACETNEIPGVVQCTSAESVECLTSGTNACGGTQILDQQLGQPCGPCGVGAMACDGPNATRCSVGDDPTNACGGCNVLQGGPDEECGPCGGSAWACAGDERVVCDNASRNPCGGCARVASGVPGTSCGGSATWACDGVEALECIERATNVCGGTLALGLDIPGDPCGECGDGVWICAAPDLLVCSGASLANACGGCGVLAASAGEPCGARAVWTCDVSGSLICREATDGNACGGSAALLESPGSPCGACGSGRWACDGDDALQCVGEDLDAPEPRWWRDADGDGFGAGEALIDCNEPPGYVAIDGDCADDDPERHPGAPEQCDGVSNDCDDEIDEDVQTLAFYVDADRDGWGDATSEAVFDCAAPEGFAIAGDCNDRDGDIRPGAIERCDGVDNNCAKGADEGVSNGCGGCGELSQDPGGSCGPCALDRLACLGPDEVACDDATACPDAGIDTLVPTDIRATGATLRGYWDLEAAASALGVCWSTTRSLRGDETCVDVDAGVGPCSFEAPVAGLNPGSAYFARAYADLDGARLWGEPLLFQTGRPFVFDLEASDATREDGVALTWTRLPGAVAYRVERGGSFLAEVSDSAYLDETAPFGTLPGVATFAASDGTSTLGVELDWTLGAGTPGEPRSYRVVAVYAVGEAAASAEAIGRRAGETASAVEWQRTGSDWVEEPADSLFIDVDAPMGAITYERVEASNGTTPRHVELRVEGAEATAPAPMDYELRALSSRGASVSRIDLGYRGVDAVSIQWLRSVGPEDELVELPGATSSPYQDTSAPADASSRWYAARLSAAGAPTLVTERDEGSRRGRVRVSTVDVIDIGPSGARVLAAIDVLGAPPAQGAGVCVSSSSTSPRPGDGECFAREGELVAGPFEVELEGLDPFQSYSVAAYAIDPVGAVSGETLAFTTQNECGGAGPLPGRVAEECGCTGVYRCLGTRMECVGDEPLDLYPDTDRDTFGDRDAAPIQGCAPTEVLSINNLDCDDGSETIQPNAPDRPDPAGTDSNCDGVDGDRATTLYVSLDGFDVAPGTPEAPLRTLNAALSRAQTNTSILAIAVGSGTYAESVVLPDGLSLYGGFTDVFRNRLLGSTVIESASEIGLEVAGYSQVGEIAGLTIRSAAGGLNDPTSMALLAYDITGTLTIRDNVLTAGDGANGTSGASGASGANGANGVDGCTGCGGSNTGGTSVCGGDGGDGGAGGFQNGQAGTGGSGTTASGEVGVGGGWGGNSTSLFPCSFLYGAATPGFSGNDGVDGVDAEAIGLELGSFDGRQWRAPGGFDGQDGTSGDGGSGGGGGAGTSAVTGGGFVGDSCSQTFGGSGGGGGSGGCGGRGGLGGRGGGGSFAVVAYRADGLVVHDNQLQTGAGGDGGNGGAGGDAGARGVGGQPGEGTDDDENRRGREGGDGGAGGSGGSGGGGAGGWTAGVFLNTAYGAEIRDNSFVLGTPGAGGVGGERDGTRAPNGPDGQAVDTLVFESLPTLSAEITQALASEVVVDARLAAPGKPVAADWGICFAATPSPERGTDTCLSVGDGNTIAGEVRFSPPGASPVYVRPFALGAWGTVYGPTLSSSVRVASPTNVIASQGTSTEAVTLRWDAVDGASAYRVYRGDTVIQTTAEPVANDFGARLGELSAPAPVFIGQESDRVVLTWNPTVSSSGPVESYSVVAESLQFAESERSETVTGFRAGAAAQSYTVTARGSESSVGATERRFEDLGAPPPIIAFDELIASEATSLTEIAVSVEGLVGQDGPLASYEVRAVYEVGTSSASVAAGRRVAGPLVTQWSVSDSGPEGPFAALGDLGIGFTDIVGVPGTTRDYRVEVSASGAEPVVLSAPGRTGRAATLEQAPVFGTAGLFAVDVSVTANDAGDPAATEWGICYRSGTTDPRLDDVDSSCRTLTQTAELAFETELTGLEPGMTYSVAAYVRQRFANPAYSPTGRVTTPTM